VVGGRCVEEDTELRVGDVAVPLELVDAVDDGVRRARER
jgi:hypothetical protein